MPTIQQNFSLKEWNTFGVEAQARWFTQINSENDLSELFADSSWNEVDKLILGGGSNMLFTKDFDGLVIRMNIQGISHEIQGEQVLVRAGGGVAWNDLVKYCVAHQFSGIENLSLIPGSVGASPIQNIGAYGVELMDVFHSCRAYEIESGKIRIFNNADCHFSYRDSIFKAELKGKYIITEVSYLLSTRFIPHLNYGAIRQELQRLGIAEPTIADVSKVVSHIRVSKLPDPSTIGNAGSFFKNPIIKLDRFQQLQSAFPDMVHYPAGDGLVKLAAGWLIEQCGWKGRVLGHTGTWKNQALVIVNHGGATGHEVFNFSSQIVDSVHQRFGIVLEREVNII